MIGVLTSLGSLIIGGVTDWFKGKQEIAKAETENRVRMLKDEQNHNHEWEMKQIAGAGWKDDILFYAVLGLWVWSAFDPESAAKVFHTWETTMPDYIIEITSWLVAAVLGVKKIGDYLPGAIRGIRDAVKGDK